MTHRSSDVHYLDGALSPRQMKRLERKSKRQDRQQEKNSSVHQSLVNEHFKRKEFNLVPKNDKQAEQLAALNTKDQVICIGPAGTGKTYITAAWAAIQFDHGKIKKLILTRPNVPAGPTLGLFPGSLQEKFENWIAPVTSVIKLVLGEGAFEIAVKRGDIVYQPVETIRGMSFPDSVLIVDEAQNLTVQEMKAIVTRIGDNSKLILDGDLNQTDIKGASGLAWALSALDRSEYLTNNTGVVRFTADHIVRSQLCKSWIEAIENER